MAISGVTDADILTIAKNLGVARKKLAAELGYTYQVPTVAVTDGGTHHSHVVITNMWGLLTIDYGDGTVVKAAASSAGAPTPTDHLYASAGAKTVKVTGSGVYKATNVTLA